jgi:dihydrofolate synthase/folylpolyglutamate synthase
LERTVAALADLGDPHRAVPAIHIAGTNGKGSVASTVHSILGVAGIRAGLYTSPHLCSFLERYRLGDDVVTAPELEAAAREIREVVVERGLTFFEAITVLAFHLFARAEVEVSVVEVGLGGRLDATNVLIPLVSAVTNVALDHAEYLGETLPEIAREKAGIIKAGVPVIVAETDPGLVEIFRRTADDRGAPFLRAPRPRRVEVRRRGTRFAVETERWGELEVETPLAGEHQAVNGALAVAVAERLPEALRPSEEAVVRGIRSVRWPGRDQVVGVDGETWLLDVAHNTAGVRSLVDTLGRLDLPRPWIGLIGVLGDKDWSTMLPPLLGLLDGAWLTRPALGPVERRWDPGAAAAVLREGPPGAAASPEEAGGCELQVEPQFGRALARAREAAGEGSLVVTGSVYTVGSALRAVGRDP